MICSVGIDWLQKRSTATMRFFELAALCLSAAIVPGMSRAEPRMSPPRESCTAQALTSLDLKTDENGAILVPIIVNQIAAFMILEIGSPFSEVSQQAVARFELPEKEIDKQLDITSGTQRVGFYAETDFTLGSVSYSHEHLLVDPRSATAKKYRRSDVIGILGIDLLWNMDLELILAQRKLNLYSHSRGQNPLVGSNAANYTVVPLQRDAFGSMYLPIELDGRKIEAVLTTGSPVSTLSTDVTRLVFGFDKTSAGVETVIDADGAATSHYRVMKLTGSGLTLADERVKLTDPPESPCRLARKGDAIGYTGCLYRYPLKLGSDVLARLHVYIATDENVMYYAAETPVAAKDQDGDRTSAQSQ